MGSLATLIVPVKWQEICFENYEKTKNFLQNLLVHIYAHRPAKLLNSRFYKIQRNGTVHCWQYCLPPLVTVNLKHSKYIIVEFLGNLFMAATMNF